MTKPMRYKKQIAMWAMLCLTLLVVVFIFSNSAKDAPSSSQQSDKVVEIVRPPAEVILPIIDVEPSVSNIVSIVRKSAHILEFALLGCMAFWTTLLWTKKTRVRAVLPIGCSVVTALLDETIQLGSPGRAWQMEDILADCTGVLFGVLFALLCAWLLGIVFKKRRKQE